MLTYSGVHVTREYGVPTVRDIAVQSMRVVRFCGSGEIFWPVGMHLLFVAALVPPELEHHALLHDAAEICVSDIPRPMKTSGQKELEHWVLARIYNGLGLALPTKAEAEAIHTADMRAVNVEGCFGACGPGFREAQPAITKDDEAVKVWEDLLNKVGNSGQRDMLCATGYWPRLLERRIREAVTRVHNSVKYVESYT